MSLSKNVFLRVFQRRRSDRCHSLDHRWWGIPTPPLQSRCIPYVSHHWRNAKCVCICCLPRFCSWHIAFEWRSNNESLGQIKMCCFLYFLVVLSDMQCRLPFLSVCPCRQSCFRLSGSGIFNQTSPPQLRPHGRSFATPTLQDFKEKKLCRYHQIHHVCPTQRSRTISEILSKNTWAFWSLLSFQGKCGQGDPLERRWLRSIDILGIRNQSRSSLALQVTQCQIQIHHDPPSFPSFVEESGVHGPRHGL